MKRVLAFSIASSIRTLIAQYFSNLNYDNKFITKVLNSLESNFKRPPPRGLVVPSTSIDRRSEDKKRSV